MRTVAVLAVALVLGISAFAAEPTVLHTKAPFLDVESPALFALLNSTADGTFKVANWSYGLTLASDGYERIATALHNQTLTAYGWDYLYVAPEAALVRSDPDAAYHAAGYAEGWLSYDQLKFAGAPGAFDALVNGVAVEAREGVRQWLNSHIDYMQTAIRTNSSQAFYRQLGKLFQQLQGIVDGFTARAKASGEAGTTLRDVFALNFGEEVGDVEGYVKYFGNARNVPRVRPARHCSALIKITADDLFMSHTTWSSFQSMRRMYKVYAFETTVAMSSYPGQIASQDDWYMTSNKLAIQETTNEFYNNALYAKVVPRTVSEFLRTMIATHLASNGSHWTSLFKQDNSGTYNNQYMVVDMKLWAPGEIGAKLQDNLLWLAEQIPGYVERSDVTDVLRQQGYWPSFNVAYFPYIYNVSGFRQKLQEQGTFWSYTKYARPEIFRRNQSGIKDLTGMQSMMRYNDYKIDPYSRIPNCSTCPNQRCSPSNSAMLTISSRGDLNPVDAPGICYGPLKHFVSHRDHCATDAKIASWSNFQDGKLTGIAISGPTAAQQPVFAFSNSTFGPAPQGMPDAWNFPWMEFVLPRAQPSPYKIPHIGLPGSNKALVGAVVGAAVVGFIFAVAGVYYARRVRARSSTDTSYATLDGGVNARTADGV